MIREKVFGDLGEVAYFLRTVPDCQTEVHLEVNFRRGLLPAIRYFVELCDEQEGPGEYVDPDSCWLRVEEEVLIAKLSSQGQLFFGVTVGDGRVLPWTPNEKDYEEEMEYEKALDEAARDGTTWDGETWWLDRFVPETSSDSREEALKKYPPPFEMINYYEYPEGAYALAVPGTVFTATRGFPKRTDPETMKGMIDEKKLKLFREFCQEYGIPEEPEWLLTTCLWKE